MFDSGDILLKSIYRKLAIVRELVQLRDQNRQFGHDYFLSTAIQREYYRQQLLLSPRYAHAQHLFRFEAKYFSQNGEDGIIREIFNRIGITNSFFVEFGVGEGTENNTACLLFQNWCGLWVDANPQPRKQARSFIKSGRLQFHSGIVTRDNVNEILKQMKVPSDPDLLSIDMDLNTYHIWQAMEVIRPRAVVVEYNANFPPSVEWIADYNPPQFWDHTSYFGASLKSYEILGTRLGYCLVGCDFMGVNAFFIRHDLCSGKFISPYTSEMHYEPPRFGTAGFGHVIRLA